MLFRNRRLVRVIACYLLLQTISSLAFPTVSLAMMGPSQPEFTSYEAPGATDLVNLVTGDFTYSVPVLDIPGPERSFSLPLTYKAGIQLEQEASWVGLGWSLNAGAVARSINGYADDANNEPTQTTFNKKIDRGWNSGFSGIVNLGWNSITGHSGTVDLIGLASVGWDKDGINRGDLVGIGYTAGQGFSIDPVRLTMAAVTIATLGSGSSLSLAANIGIQAGSSVAIGAAVSAIGLGHMSGVGSFNNSPTRSVEDHWWGDNYWNFYANNTTEDAFGSLYFGKMSQHTVSTAQSTGPVMYTEHESPPPIKYGAQASVGSTAQLFKYTHSVTDGGNTYRETAADVYQDATIQEKQLQSSTNANNAEVAFDIEYNRQAARRPISTAHDYFSVMGESVSGTIRPYRLDVGSIAYPKLESNVVQAFDSDGDPYYVVPHFKHMAIPFLDTKVGFRYENSLSNGYAHHQYTPTGADEPTGFTATSNPGELVVTDSRLLTERTAAARKGLYDANAGNAPHLVTGKQVTWYSNAEISAMYASSTNGAGNGFLEFEHPQVSTLNSGASTNNRFRALAPPSGIGAFAVTGEDGTTYHYSLPVYQYQTYSESNEIATQIGDKGKMTRRTGLSSPTNPTGGQATTWLLTAITSADYIDRNNSGTVDAEDWGGWVKFEYGKFSSRYKWRQPYIGRTYSGETPGNSSWSFTEGYKETYYLNAISTRSHTALFLKSVRQDGRGHFRFNITATPNYMGVSNLGIDERKPASSLRLDEIVLLDNVTLSKLRTTDGIRAAGEPPVPALSNSTGSSLGTYVDDPMDNSGDDMSTVLDIHDVEAENRIRKFINANAIKRIRFNYSYDLCRGTPNSFQCQNATYSLPDMTEAAMSQNRGGKLTLKSVSFFGPSINDIPTKIIPDFSFSYDTDPYGSVFSNPGYGKEKWDTFGMYNFQGSDHIMPTGTYVGNHRPDNDNRFSAPWTLRKVTSPLGGVTEIEYERDQYAHVSEYGTEKIRLSNADCSATFNVSSYGIPLTSVLQPNQYVYLTGMARYNDCVMNNNNGTSVTGPRSHPYWHEKFRIASVTNTQITLTAAPTPKNWNPTWNCQSSVAGLGADFEMVVPVNVVGGDVRVAAITTREGADTYQVRYKYVIPNSEPNTSGGFGSSYSFNSTGVLAKEPASSDHFEHPSDAFFDYPTTPVLYSQVTVLRGLFRNNDDKDYETREVYSFHTPVSSMISEVVPNWKVLHPYQYSYNSMNYYSHLATSTQTTVDVGRIGQPSKVEIYNRRGERELSTEFTYASNVNNPDALAGQGHYTEGVLNNERVQYIYRINRSTKEYVPAVLSGSRSTRNGLTINNNNVLYDFYTGQVLESALTNSLGRVYHSRSVPAYTLAGNEGMGAKGDKQDNRHMLAQQGAMYTYLEVPGGPTYNPLNPLNPRTSRVLSAGVQTWQQNWNNYRETDANGTYQDVPGQNPVWRQAAAYTWQSSILYPDGSFKNFVPFVWTGNSDAHWVKASEIVRYDHYSHALESRDANGNYGAQKTGYNQTQLIASATNARYTELAYSGAEDQLAVNSATHFGGEITAGGTPDQQADHVHTGFYSNQLAAGQKGFIYRVQAGRDVDINKTYRVSAWVHANAPQGKVYAALNGTRIAEASRTSANTKKAGSWYLLNLLVPVPASASGQTVEFGCVNDGAIAGNFDDFRVAPLVATVTSKVYDPRTNNLLYSLDNDNLFTHYEYTPTGRLKRIYQETLDGTGTSSGASAEKLVKEYEFNYAQLLFPTWVTSIYTCELDAFNNNTGYELRQLIDINPLNNPPTPPIWETNGLSPTCTIPVCEEFDNVSNEEGIPIPQRLHNNVCEAAELIGVSCVSCGSNRFVRIGHWRWADMTSPPDTRSDCIEGDCYNWRPANKKATTRTQPRVNASSAKDSR